MVKSGRIDGNENLLLEKEITGGAILRVMNPIINYQDDLPVIYFTKLCTKTAHKEVLRDGNLLS